jgi:chromate transporter
VDGTATAAADRTERQACLDHTVGQGNGARAGTLGALATSVAFVAPSFALVLAVAVVYARYEGLPVMQALFSGIAPAVMAIVAVAAYKLARMTNRRDRRLWTVSRAWPWTALTGAEIAGLRCVGR